MDALRKYLGELINQNGWREAGTALGIFVLALAILILLKKIVLSRLKAWSSRSANRWDDIFFQALVRTQNWFLLLLAAAAALGMLKLSPAVDRLLRNLVFSGFLLQTALWGSALITGYLAYYRSVRLESDAEGVTTVGVLGFLAKLALFSVLLIIGFENAGINVTALVAGLGIGGVAVALAAQNVLGDLFASLAIALDKPFAIGDFLVLDTLRGTVERIGMKTTHIRSLDGELIVLPNSHLINSRLRNFKRMRERRVLLNLGVVYETPLALQRKIPEILRAAVEGRGQTRFDRAHLSGLGEYAIQFETVFFVLSPDYTVFMDLQEAILFDIQERFQREGIGFAYPTRTLLLRSSEGRALGEAAQSLPGTAP